MEHNTVFTESKRTSEDIPCLKKISNQYSGNDSIDYDGQVKRIQFEITRFLLAEMTN